MDRSIAQALTGLIPSFSGPLPPELLELAVSLLAQSRNKASSLKAGEEIARSLKLNLGLPKIEPRPPCPPQIYQRLYKYLDSTLTAGTRRSGRPSRTIAATTPTSSPNKPKTPAKQAPLRPAASRRKVAAQAAIATEVPKWVLPTIRHVCKALGAPAAPHHIFAGVSSILTLPAPRTGAEEASKEESSDVNVPALIIVVYLLVVTRLTGKEMSAQEFTRLRGLAIASIRESGIEEASEEAADSDSVITSIVSWMRDIGAKGWTELDWFANIGEGAGLEIAEPGDDDEAKEASELNEIDHEVADPLVGRMDISLDDGDASILRPGLGTMVRFALDVLCFNASAVLISANREQMQDRVDYLSEPKIREYEAWKKGILLRCEEIERTRQMDELAD